MKLLVDENLPPRLIRELDDLFPDSLYVSTAGLRSTPDADIWEYAKNGGFTFITKDRDFADLSIVRGAPPKVILLQIGNCPAIKVVRFLRDNAIRLSDFDTDPGRSLLVLR